MSTAQSLALMAAFVVSVAATTTDANPRMPESIEVFTTSDHAVHGAQRSHARLYLLDGLNALERSLSQDLPSEPEKAKAIALQRLSVLEDALQIEVEKAVEGLSLATSYGLRKLPAIVFDGGKSVVYGVDRLDRAIAIYQDSPRP